MKYLLSTVTTESVQHTLHTDPHKAIKAFDEIVDSLHLTRVPDKTTIRLFLETSLLWMRATSSKVGGPQVILAKLDVQS